MKQLAIIVLALTFVLRIAAETQPAATATSNSNSTSSERTQKAGDNAEKASEAGEKSSAMSGMNCIMMMNMARGLSGSAAYAAFMMAMQSCNQASEDRKASRENKNVRNKLSEEDGQENVPKKLEELAAFKTPEPPKEEDLTLTLDENVAKREPLTLPTASPLKVGTVTVPGEKTAAEEAVANPEVSTLSAIERTDPRDPNSPELPSYTGAAERGYNTGNRALASLGSVADGPGKGIAVSAREADIHEEKSRLKPSGEVADASTASASSESKAESGGGSSGLDDLLKSLTGGGDAEGGAIIEVIDTQKLRKKTGLANIFELARFRYEYLGYKEKRVRMIRKADLNPKVAAKTP